MKPSLMLNMIVRNESARIVRCLSSVLPHVKSVAILDTGSTDDTRAIINRLCDEAGVHCYVHAAIFKDFGQARNDAFEFAQRSNGGCLPWCQFALVMDADMELVVDDPQVFHQLNANALSYDMMQKGGAVSYANRRLINTNWGQRPYIGATHEYVDVPSAGMIAGARFIDHADGANRVNKYKRDAVLLTTYLQEHPDDPRSLYYLGNTYRDDHEPEEAVRVYDKRIALGGWDEETHSSMMNRASCYKDAGNEALFVQGMITAYNFRPSRAEPLYDLAVYFREKGEPSAALVFAKAGLNKKRPDDLLFVNDFVYQHGLRYEYSIAGFYDETERPRAFEITDDLSLDPSFPEAYRWSCRSNLQWYTKPLKDYCPSFQDHTIVGLASCPAGYTMMNPSVEVCQGRVLCNVRCVNYKINEHGQYMIGEKGCGDAPIDTQNIICTLHFDDDNNMSVVAQRTIKWDRPPAAFGLVTGLEDIRLWRYCGELKFSATVRELTYQGLCQMVQGSLLYSMDDREFVVDNWKVISDGEHHEKNWMPMPSAPYGSLRFMYRLDTVIEPGALKRVATVTPGKLSIGNISGSSQLVEFNMGYLAVVHEAITATDGKRTYWHRFAKFGKDGVLRMLSKPFVFLDRQIEFCAGLARHPDHRHMIISFGVRDEEAHVATVTIDDIQEMLRSGHEG